MKKILFIIDTVEVGGATKLTLDLINNLDKTKYSYSILYLNATRFGSDDLLNYFGIEENAELLRYEKFRSIKRILYLYKNFRKFDLVHSCMDQANFYSSFVKMLPFSNFKLVIPFHGLDSSYIEDMSLIKPPKASFIHTLIMKHLQNLLFKRVNLFIAVCESIKYYLIKYRKVNEDKIKVIFHGLNIEYMDELMNKVKDFNLIDKKQRTEFKIGYIGRLGYSKGLEGFIDILPNVYKSIPNLKVTVKGDGELKEYLINKSSELSLSEIIEFENFDKGVVEFYQKTDLIVLPSYYETTNLTILESMYSGTMVLCSDAGGLPEIVKNNFNGFMFKTGDFDELAQKIFEISEMDNEKIKVIRENAFDTVNSKFNFNKNSVKIEKLFDELINSE